MKRSLLILFCLGSYCGVAQMIYEQYFDGSDTTSTSIDIIFDADSNNVWQIGAPQKTMFNSANSQPYAILTDTINNYPPNNTSSFTVVYPLENNVGIMAAQWVQKLDLDFCNDFAILEFSSDHGLTWEPVFDNQYLYNFYGYDVNNVCYTNEGIRAFSGTDSSWKNVWFCLDYSYYSTITDSIYLKFTLSSDSIETLQEGWMIDNMLLHQTWVHTIDENGKDYMTVFPNITSDRLFIETKKLNEFHIIESIEMYSESGKLVKKWGASPTKFSIYINDVPSGMYLLKVRTNLQTETFKIFKE